MRKSSKRETLTAFRRELMQHYTRFRGDVLALSERHGAEAVSWSSPSRIPQHKFVLGRIAIDADYLINDQEFNPPPIERSRSSTSSTSRSI